MVLLANFGTVKFLEMPHSILRQKNNYILSFFYLYYMSNKYKTVDLALQEIMPSLLNITIETPYEYLDIIHCITAIYGYLVANLC